MTNFWEWYIWFGRHGWFRQKIQTCNLKCVCFFQCYKCFTYYSGVDSVATFFFSKPSLHKNLKLQGWKIKRHHCYFVVDLVVDISSWSAMKTKNKSKLDICSSDISLQSFESAVFAVECRRLVTLSLKDFIIVDCVCAQKASNNSFQLSLWNKQKQRWQRNCVFSFFFSMWQVCVAGLWCEIHIKLWAGFINS